MNEIKIGWKFLGATPVIYKFFFLKRLFFICLLICLRAASQTNIKCKYCTVLWNYSMWKMGEINLASDDIICNIRDSWNFFFKWIWGMMHAHEIHHYALWWLTTHGVKGYYILYNNHVMYDTEKICNNYNNNRNNNH